MSTQENGIDTLTLDYETLRANTTKYIDASLRRDFQAKQISLTETKATRSRRGSRRRRRTAAAEEGEQLALYEV